MKKKHFVVFIKDYKKQEKIVTMKTEIK